MDAGPMVRIMDLDDDSESESQSETTFDDLEDELKEKILTYIDSTRERQILRRVAKSWHGVINSAFGIKLVVNNLNCDLLKTCDCVTELELNSLTRPIDIDKIKFHNRLRTLTFYNIVVTYNLFPLLSSMQKLTEVSFHESVLDLPENLIVIPQDSDSDCAGGSSGVGRKACNIQKLSFQSWNFATSLVGLLGVLSKLQFGSLKEISISTTFTPFIPFHKVFLPNDHPFPASLHPFVRLIVKNLPSIQLVCYGPRPNQTRLKFYPTTPNHPYEVGQVKQLEELTIIHYAHPDYSAIIFSQNRLRVLEIGGCKFDAWPIVRNCISANAATLEKIYLKTFTFGQEWNCDVFANLKSLEDLALHMNASAKSNLGFLPISLRILDLDGPISKDELEHLYQLTNLEHLHLLGLGLNLLNILPDEFIDLDERIGLNMIKLFIIRLPKLRALTFKECSTGSLDWDRITDWLNNEAPDYGIHVELFHYDMQGRRTIHGFTLLLPESEDVRTNIAIDIGDDLPTGGLQSFLEETSDALVSLLES